MMQNRSSAKIGLRIDACGNDCGAKHDKEKSFIWDWPHSY
jgi:hypothetical protein